MKRNLEKEIEKIVPHSAWCNNWDMSSPALGSTIIKKWHKEHPCNCNHVKNIEQLLSLFSKTLDNVIGENRILTEEETNSNEGDNLTIDYSMVRKDGWNSAKEESRARKKELGL